MKVKYVVLTNNGSIALLISMMALNIKKKDEIIIPNCGWISPAHAAQIIGAKIRLVDVEKNKPIISIKNLIKAINSKTKAIIPIHLNGRGADIYKIKKIIRYYRRYWLFFSFDTKSYNSRAGRILLYEFKNNL